MGAPWQQRDRDPFEREFGTYMKLRRQWAGEIIDRDATVEQWGELKQKLRALGETLSGRDFIAWLSSSWLATASADIRFVALREIAHRCDRLRVAQGLQPLDDPMPPAQSVFTLARGIIGDNMTKART